MAGNSEKNRYKLDYFSSFFWFFGIEKLECSMHLECSVENEKNTVVELGCNYETSELKPFLHQQWIYIREKNERGEIETKKIESPLAGTPKTEKGYQGFSHTKDLWYLKIPLENDRENYLILLPNVLFLNIFYKACISEHEEYQCLLCKEIRRLPVCPNTGWVHLVTTALVATQHWNLFIHPPGNQ